MLFDPNLLVYLFLLGGLFLYGKWLGCTFNNLQNNKTDKS